MVARLDAALLDLQQDGLGEDCEYFLDVAACFRGGLEEGDALLLGEAQSLFEGDLSPE